MKRIGMLVLALLVMGARADCQGGNDNAAGGGPGTYIHPGTPLDIPFGHFQLIAAHADAFFATIAPEHVVYADELWAAINTGEAVFIVDVRDVRDQPPYESGHIPTAVHLPLPTLFTEESLLRLPVDGTPIVVVGKDGNAGALAAGALATLGYTVYPLAYGMIGWNTQTMVAVSSASTRLQRISGFGGPLEY